MTRSTPEGARDYLVPSRVNPGTFLRAAAIAADFQAAPDGGGFEKYFQIVRCFRDEDLRADRQPEFTQIDLEMSFPQQEPIFEVIEPLIGASAKRRAYRAPSSIPRLTYAEAMQSYGSDKPDLRIPPFHCVEDLFAGENLTPEGLPLVAIHIPKTGALSRKERDELKAFGQERGLRVYRRREAPGARFPHADGGSSRRAPVRPKTICCCWRAGRANPRAIVPKRPCCSPADSCVCTRRRSMPTGTSCWTRRISSFSGWWTSRCSNGTRKRAAGTPRIIPSLRCMTRISKS